MEQTFETVKPKTYEMLYDLAKESILDHDIAKAKKAIDYVFHTFASRLDIDQGIIVISNLPTHLKTHFSKGWTPFRDIKSQVSEDFIGALKKKDSSFFNSFNIEQIKKIVKRVFFVLVKYIQPEKMRKIESCFCQDLRTILAS